MQRDPHRATSGPLTLRRHGLIHTAAIASTLVVAGAAFGQTDVLYASSQAFSNNLHRVQGGTLLQTATRVGSNEAAIAVWGDVRTACRNGTAGFGAQYDLSLNPMGPTYSSAAIWYNSDGTSDGNYNYAFAYSSSDVVRYDRNWQSPVVICSLSKVNNLGITYDTSTGLFWGVSITGADTIFSFDLAGNIYSSFNTQGIGVFQDGLAYEPSTDTLWTISEGFNQNPWLTQYSKTGTMLQQFQTPGFTDQYIGGIEFDLHTVPTPGAAALAALALPWLARRRRA